jgi:hypothetical protein
VLGGLTSTADKTEHETVEHNEHERKFLCVAPGFVTVLTCQLEAHLQNVATTKHSSAGLYAHDKGPQASRPQPKPLHSRTSKESQPADRDISA